MYSCDMVPNRQMDRKSDTEVGASAKSYEDVTARTFL